MSGEACPCCGGAVTVAGSTYPIDGVPPCFRPFVRHDLRYWLRHFGCHTGIQLTQGFRACPSCGLVWGRLPPDRLRNFVAREDVVSPPKTKALEAEL
jgi:hypothetical protein